MTTFEHSFDAPAIPFTLAQAPAAGPNSDELIGAPVAGPAPANTTATTATAAQPATTAPAPGGLGGSPLTMPLLIVLMLAVMIIPSMLASKREKKKRAALMAAMGKGDKVITIGGQIGVIDQVRDQEVVLRIDENSNAKARFSKASIQQVLESAGKPSGEAVGGMPTVEVKAKSDSPLPAR
ncbi:MAG TPA: preprotein translocase subunit YajC [Phycisphaerales bacterium]|nr:preprotein translocase subunit YajC [Phycisphaerales bacterium]